MAGQEDRPVGLVGELEEVSERAGAFQGLEIVGEGAR
jgi:hypothetical protein